MAHVPHVLAERCPTAIEAEGDEIRALRTALSRRNLKRTVAPGLVHNTYRCRLKSNADELVSIIIPTCAARGLIKNCIESIRSVSTYKNIEIICVENIPEQDGHWKPWLRENCDVVIEIAEPFNWSALQ